MMALWRARITPPPRRGVGGGVARRRALLLMVLLAPLAAAGCGEETLPLVVTSTSPPPGARGVAITTEVTAAFAVVLDSQTVTKDSFTLKVEGGAAIPGVVNVAGNKAIFSPSVKLKRGTTYRATLTTAIRARDGRGLAANYTWTFST